MYAKQTNSVGICVHKEEKTSGETDNPYEKYTQWDRDSGDSYGDRRGNKMREQVTTQRLGNRIPKGKYPMERPELTQRCMYWGICQYSKNYPERILRIKIRMKTIH